MATLQYPTPEEARKTKQANQLRERARRSREAERRFVQVQTSARDPDRMIEEDVTHALNQAFHEALAEDTSSREVCVEIDQVWKLAYEVAQKRLGQKASYPYHLNLESIVESLRIPKWTVHYDDELERIVFLPNECCTLL